MVEKSKMSKKKHSKKSKHSKKHQSRSKKSCEKGKIMRVGYVRKMHHRLSRSGKPVHVEATYVKETCIPDVGKPGKTPVEERVIPQLKRGEVSQFGYSTKLESAERQKALVKAVRELGCSAIQKHMVALRTLNKGRPEIEKILDEDVKFLQEKCYPERFEARMKKVAEEKLLARAAKKSKKSKKEKKSKKSKKSKHSKKHKHSKKSKK